MYLDNTSHRQRTNFHETEAPEVLSLKNIDVPLIREKDVWLVLQCMPIDSPQAPAKPIIFESLTVVRIVQMVIVNRR